MWAILFILLFCVTPLMAQDLVVEVTIKNQDIALLNAEVAKREVSGETPSILIRSQVERYLQQLREYEARRREQTLLEDFRRQSEIGKQATEAEARR